MTFDGSAIKALLDDAVSKGAVHGIAAVVVNRSGPLFHHAAGEALLAMRCAWGWMTAAASPDDESVT